MLRLLQSPAWHADGADPAVLPCTLPSALAIHLAAQGGWVERERAACLFWPERPSAQAMHNLRVTLHRVRRLVQLWGHEAALQTERQRIRLVLPSDLTTLENAITRSDGAALTQLAPWRLLEGFRLAGFESFDEWVEGERQRLTRAWGQACERALGAVLRAGCGDQAHFLFNAWHAQGLVTALALARLHAEVASESAESLWRDWQASAQEIENAPAPVRASALMLNAGDALLLRGRDSEQAALRGGRMAATLIGGEPGMGKTLLATATFPGCPLMRCREALEAVPYGPLAALLRHHPGWLAELGPYRLDVARLLPEVAPDEALPPLDAHTAKLRLLEGLARLVEHQAPLLLVDDLQWCDGATLEWLVFVAHRGRLRWVATARIHQLPASIQQALQALHSAKLLIELPLGPLGGAGLAALCRARWPRQEWPPERVDALWQRCGGNPFFAGELVAAGLEGDAPPLLPGRSGELIRQRLRALGPLAQAVLDAAAVLARPVALPLLAATCGSAHSTGPAEALAECVLGCEQALSAQLLVESSGGIECRHDLIRAAVYAGLSAPRRQWLHRRAALALGAAAEPLVQALHWDAAGEAQTAHTWRHRGALQLKDHGRLDEARALWQQIADDASDPALALRARLALAECALFEDLDFGRDALEAVLGQVAFIADPLARDQLHAQVLAGLVDNRVFAGDQPRARVFAGQLRPFLPRLDADDRVHAIEALIELAMREPDIADALALLAQARRLRPKRPALLSFEAQIHWFGGQVLAARAAFERLFERHPDYCRGLTLENDLAVMCHALGDLHTAETMARRSLVSWKGVAHTETLSLLVLGATLTSAGRYAEAGQTLDLAEGLARQQSSQLFLSEVHSRRARLLACCGRYGDALAQIEQAAALVHDADNPLRLSQLLLLQAACQAASGQALDAGLRSRLQAACARSAHPLVHARLAHLEAQFALVAGESEQASNAAQRMLVIAREAGLQETLAEALLLRVRTLDTGSAGDGAAQALAHEAALLAQRHGYRDLAWRACTLLARQQGGAGWQDSASAWRAQLGADAGALGFDAAAAARREPRVLSQI